MTVVVVVSLAGYAGVTVVVVMIVARGGGGVERTETQLYSKGDANRTAIRFASVTSFLIPLSLPYFGAMEASGRTHQKPT